MIRVSIIMGVYNCENTLSEAIDSIIQQTYKGWKLIICDDGSEDGTLSIAKQYEKQYENIHVYVNKKNMGLNYTLNHCLSYVDTEYVARMDGDDISLPTRLEKEISFLDNHKEYSIVSTPMIYFDENGDFMVGSGNGEVKKKDFIKGTPFCHAPCMVRSEAYRKVGGYTVRERLLRVEDYHLWYKMYLNGYMGYNLKDPLYKMRDDRNATKRRKYKYRINEAYVRRLVIKDFKLPFIDNIYVIRPLLVGLLPTFLYKILHRMKKK